MPDEESPKVEVVVSDKSSKPRNMTPVYMAVIAVVFLGIGFFARGSVTGAVVAGESKDVAASKAASFINSNLLSAGQTASVTSVNESNGMYVVTLSINGQSAGSVYVSKDGNYLILGTVLDMNKALPREEESESAAATEIPKSDRPSVELFVMSFCPYGVQAEQAMAPVVELLGDKADIKVRFIASASGTNLSSIRSLHGNIEGVEDARQLCIAENYDTATYWKYLAEINSKCYPIYRSGDAAYDACWKAAAATAGIDVGTVEGCLSSEGVALINAESAAADAYGVSGSPTLIINGGIYSGGRTPEAFKTAICNAFNEAPSECGQTLSAAGASTASGGCA
ncbi:MAG: hypothetical protein FJY76_01415 [Candidatus Aenigmarchaeota archaeon]|nr:hypothetical protein [Candidatus Aenigmarchaeota archaeon]